MKYVWLVAAALLFGAVPGGCAQAGSSTPAPPATALVPWLIINENGGYGMARFGYDDHSWSI